MEQLQRPNEEKERELEFRGQEIDLGVVTGRYAPDEES